MTEPLASIVLSRIPAPWRDQARAYKLFVDGQAVGEIRPGEEVTHEVSPGTHTLTLKVDRKGLSEALTFALGPGEAAYLVCEPAGSAMSAVVDLFSRRAWISLRPDPDH
jgi:Penicillin-Binding Protein C-terminus Family